MPSTLPTIFSDRRKDARLQRAAQSQTRTATTRFLIDEMCDDIIERLAFLRLSPETILIDRSGFPIQQLPGCGLTHTPADFDQPFAAISGGFDVVASLASLDTVNDLPGALIHMRSLLKPGGLAVATFVGGASLPALRRAMFEAEPDRPAARIHPMIDPRSCPGLLSRAGWSDPVVDTHKMTVRYSSLDRLVSDLREQALGNALASAAPPLSRPAYHRAKAAFAAGADPDGKVSETFELVTLTGRR